MAEVSSIEPGQIFADIQAQPPLMRQQAANAYLGREVHWALTFEDGNEDQSGEAWVVFRFDSHNVRMVEGRVSLSVYPSLRSMRSGETALVHGWVCKIGALSIELEIQDLVFAKAAEAAR